MQTVRSGRSVPAVFLIGVLCLAWLLPGLAQTPDAASGNCPRAKIVAVFAGHTDSLKWMGNHQGVKSASGVWEYRYNDQVATHFAERSTPEVIYKIFPASLNIPYQSRAELAMLLGAEALLEIHHDGVQPRIARSLECASKDDPRLSYYRGFSLHIYPQARSLALAKEIEAALIAAGCPSSTYHQEDIPGERMSLISGTRATYARDGLALLKRAQMPAVIVECGCISNPQEDNVLKRNDYQLRIVDAVHRAVGKFFRNGHP